ncbi:MAG: aminopeptidase [Bacteroidetes bacterium]|nr:aminopeptidase [Bacteroidota bacterium]
MKKIVFSLFLLLLNITFLFAQNPELPKGMTLISSCKATEVKSQDNTGTCWSFSTSSFIESEILKTTGKSVDISEMFTVRKIYEDKAERYVRYQGHRPFSQGSLAHDVFRVYTLYGLMPESAYPGKADDAKHNHTALEKELKSFLDTMIASGSIKEDWQKDFNSILDQHLGKVPEKFKFEGKKYTARTFADEVVPLKFDDYIGITSFTNQPMNQFVIVQVPDNYSDGKYYNVSLDEMMVAINTTLTNGYSIEWDGDVSEPGFVVRSGYAVLSDDTATLRKDPLKAKEEKVNPKIRQKEFDSYETTDDHLMHITGIVKSTDGRTFYLVKNSWGTLPGFDGYLLMSESYLRMKTISVYMNIHSLPANYKTLQVQH